MGTLIYIWGAPGAELSTWSLFIGPVLTPLTPLTRYTHGQCQYGLTLPDTDVEVSGRVSIDTGVGVSRVSAWCQDLVSVEVSSQGSTDERIVTVRAHVVVGPRGGKRMG